MYNYAPIKKWQFMKKRVTECGGGWGDWGKDRMMVKKVKCEITFHINKCI